jgi:conjugative transposon TraN protein
MSRAVAPNKPFLNGSGQSYCIRQVYFRFQCHGTTIDERSLVLQGRSVQHGSLAPVYGLIASQCRTSDIEQHRLTVVGIQYLLKGIYVHSDLLYFHTEIKNQSNVPFDVDYITFKVVDKKVAKRTAIQEQVLLPVRAYNYVVRVAGKKTEQTVFCLPKFTIPDDKELVVEMNEKEGGRHQSFVVENSDLVRALTINELSVK